MSEQTDNKNWAEYESVTPITTQQTTVALKVTTPVTTESSTTTETPQSTLTTTSLDTLKVSKEDKNKYGKYTKDDFFERDGDLILKSTFFKNLNYNISDYISALPSHYSNELKQLVRKAIHDLMGGLRNGGVKPTDAGFAEIAEAADRRKNTEKGFDAYGLAQYFVNEVWLNQTPWKNPDANKPKSLFSSEDFAKNFNKLLFAGREDFDETFWDLDDDYDESTKKRGIKQRLTLSKDKLNLLRTQVLNGELYSDSDEKQKQDILNYIDTALGFIDEGITNGKLSGKAKLALKNLGIDPDMYYGTKKSYSEEEEEIEPEKELTELEKLQKEGKELEELMLVDELRSLVDAAKTFRLWQLMSDSRQEWKLGNPTEDNKVYLDYLRNLNPSLAESSGIYDDIYRLISQVLNNFKNGVAPTRGITTAKHRLKKGDKEVTLFNSNQPWKEKLTAILDAFYTLRDKYTNYTGVNNITDDGDLVVASTKDGYGICYNYRTKTIYKRPLSSIYGKNSDILKEIWKKLYNIQEPQVLSEKQGGILKAQWGGNINDARQRAESKIVLFKALLEAQKAQKLKELEANASQSGRTVELYLAGQLKMSEKGLGTSDMLRIATAAADVTALVASFAPGGGTAVSAAAGLTSVGTDLAADMLDPSVSKLQVIKNAGINLGLSAVALLPGGGTSKVGKTVAKVLPLALQAISAANIALDPEVHKSVDKVTKGKFTDMTVDDWKNISHVFSVVTGIGTTAGNAYKLNKYKKLTAGTKNPSKVKILTKDGAKEIEVEKMNEIDAIGLKSGKEAANAKFKELTGSDLPESVTYKTSGPFKGLRSNLATREEVINATNAKQNFLLRRNEARGRLFNRTWLGKYLNSDYDIYVNGKGLFRKGFNWFSGDEKAWLRYLERMANQSKQNENNNEQAALLIRGLLEYHRYVPKKPGTQFSQYDPIVRPLPNPVSLPAKNQPLIGWNGAIRTNPNRGFSFRHLPENTLYVNLKEFRNPDGSLNADGVQFLQSYAPNWKDHLYTGHGLKKHIEKQVNKFNPNIRNLDRIAKDPKNVVVENGIVFYWKQGGLINQAKNILKSKEDLSNPFKFAEGGKVLKFQGGGSPESPWKNWLKIALYFKEDKDLEEYLKEYGDFGNKGHRYDAGEANGLGRGPEQYTNNNTNINTTFENAYNAVDDYVKKGRWQTDLNTIYENWKNDPNNANRSDSDFMKDYNADVKKLEDFRRYYKGLHYNEGDWTDYNTIFLKLYGTYNKYSEKLFDQYGNNTFLRWIPYNHHNDNVTIKGSNSKWSYDNQGRLHLILDNPSSLPIADATKIVGKPGTNPTVKIDEKIGQLWGTAPDKERQDSTWGLWLKTKGDFLGLDRFIRTLRTNKDVFKIQNKAISPVLLDTYERFSPITGDFLGMLIMSRENTDRMRAIDRAGTVAREQRDAMFLEAQQLNIKNNYVAAQYDDQERKRTAVEQLNRQEDNAERWSQVDNQSLGEINKAIREKAALKNDYKIKMNEAFQNYLGELQTNSYNDWITYKNYLANARALELQLKYSGQINHLIDKMREEMMLTGSKDATKTSAYREYKLLKEKMAAEVAMANYWPSIQYGEFPEYKFQQQWFPKQSIE